MTTVGALTTEATAHFPETNFTLDPRRGSAALGVFKSPGPADVAIGFTGVLAYGTVGTCEPSLQAGLSANGQLDLQYVSGGDEDITVAVIPGIESHSFTLNCSGHSNPPITPYPIWAPAWLAISTTLPGLHPDGYPHVVLDEEDISGGSPFARKTFRRKVIDGESTWQEDETVVTVCHRRVR